jgi:hypothetical protein
MKEFNIYTGEKGKLKYSFTSVFESEEEAKKEALETLKFEYEALPKMPTYQDAVNEAENQSRDAYETVALAKTIYYSYILSWGEYKVVSTEEDSMSQENLIKAYVSNCDKGETSGSRD